ncbi:extracellular solute-binding protein [Aerosakkonemataceae cyanobacterium BLCC-F154]|uniref:Extracellular solute-binding protein n=1 Tax=Floridaenema fluviatile BLCC-F154 TaxID=3153640 RepID=A0ABV4YDB7_9CYAN
MKRRDFLLGTGTVTVLGLISACSSQQQASLRIRLLKDSIPAQLLNKFRQEFQQIGELDLTVEAQLLKLFESLQIKPKSPDWWSRLPLLAPREKVRPSSDLVTLGDYWLAAAIEQKLIQPLDPDRLKNWQKLPLQYQRLVRRNQQGNIDLKGEVWGAPYRWGTTMIAYRKDIFQDRGFAPPQDWDVLWKPELRDRISLLDQPREVIGLTLKKIDRQNSYNTQQLDKIPQLKSELKALDRQVKFYSNNTYLQPLILGDTWVAVGWSTDILPLVQRYPNIIAAVIPQSGTSLWADLWVHPTKASNNFDLARDWIDFGWQPEIAVLFSRFGKAASPIFAGEKLNELPKSIRDKQLIFPTAEVYQKSDFLLPLSPTAQQQYLNLWQEIRFQGLGLRDRKAGGS